jgi:NAD(P)-dependent dehydrogenase (short-subunit alcohol dehydrogenase family)
VAGFSMGTVVITGGSGGLGTAVVRRFLADGWRVVATVIGEPSDQELDPGAVAVQADVTDEVAVAGAIAVAAAEPAAPLRAVVNLVGGFAEGGRVHETPVADFEAQFRLNLRPAYLVAAAALPHLIDAGGGAVLCVGTRSAVKPFSGAAGYIASKVALLGLVDALAVEYRDDGIRVNAVLPSVIDTPANRRHQPNADFSRWVQPGQIADVIAFLCSDAAAATSGAHIPVYGRA